MSNDRRRFTVQHGILHDNDGPERSADEIGNTVHHADRHWRGLFRPSVVA
jgi:hypothetical protein